MTLTDLVTIQTHNRSWLQMKANPSGKLELLSLGAMGGINEPSDATEPIYRPSRTKRRGFDKVGESVQTPDTFTSNFREGMPRDAAAYLELLKKQGKKFALHVIHHQDSDPEDPSIWESKTIFAGVKVTELTSNEMQDFSADDEVVLEGALEYDQRDRVFKMSFGVEAPTEIATEVVAAAVYPPDWRNDAETKEIYLAVKGDGASAVPKLVWSHDGGQTWTASDMTGWTFTEHPTDIALVGSFIIITSSAAEGYMWARRETPATLTEVTAGFVAGKGPTAIYAQSVASIFMAGKGGYVYKLTLPGQPVTAIENGTATVQDLNSIHGSGKVLVAVGAANAMIKSLNGGVTWALLTGPIPATVLNSVKVVDKDVWLVGADDLYYTINGGTSWVDSNLPVTGVTKVNDIAFASDLSATGFVAYSTASSGGVLRTTDFGASWEQVSFTGIPTNTGINSIAFGGPNYVVIGGVATADGVAAIGLAA